MKKKGYALPIAMLASLLMFILCVVFINTATNQINLQGRQKRKLDAEYLSEAGIEHGIANITHLTMDTIKSLQDNKKKPAPGTNKITIDLNDLNETIDDVGGYKVEFLPKTVVVHIKEYNNIFYFSKLDKTEFEIISIGEVKAGLASTDVTKNTIKVKIKLYVDSNVIKYDVLEITK